MLELMRTPGVRSIRASAVEVYHENVFDLMNERTQLSLGSSKTKFGRRVQGATESGSDDVAARGGQGGVHPSCCTCHKCFQLQEKEKERARAERALIASTRGAPPELPLEARGRHRHRTPRRRRRHRRRPRARRSPRWARRSCRSIPPSLSRYSPGRWRRRGRQSRTYSTIARAARTASSRCTPRLATARACASCSWTSQGPNASRGRARRARPNTKLRPSTGPSPRWAAWLRCWASGAARTTHAARHKAPSGHVPYRDASLTMLLRDSFGGGSCTSVVINVAGETTHVDETACSLRFGERMSVVRNEPTRVLGDANARSSRVGSPGGTKVGTLGVADLKRRLAVANWRAQRAGAPRRRRRVREGRAGD